MFFASVIVTIVLINTAIPQIVLSALFGSKVGESIGSSLRSFTRDLFLLLLVSIYFELVRPQVQLKALSSIEGNLRELKSAIHEVLPKRIRTLALESADPVDMLDRAIKRLFKGKDTQTIVKQLTPAKRIYNEVSVELRTLQVNDATVSIFVSLGLEVELSSVHVGVTKSSEHASALAASSFELFDVISIPTYEDLESIKSALHTRLKLYYRDRSGHFRELGFTAIDRSEQMTLLPAPAGMTHDDFILFRVPTSTDLSGNQKMRAEYYFDMDYDEHFIYWFADRPMFLRQLTVDASSVAIACGHPVRFQIFMAGTESVAVDIHDSRLSMKLDHWVLEGHGVVVVW